MTHRTTQSTEQPVKPIPAPDLACRKIVDEMLLVPIRTSPDQKPGIYTLNPTAARIWELIDGNRSNVDIAEVMSREYDASPSLIRTDVDSFIQTLLDARIVIPAETAK